MSIDNKEYCSHKIVEFSESLLDYKSTIKWLKDNCPQGIINNQETETHRFSDDAQKYQDLMDEYGDKLTGEMLHKFGITPEAYKKVFEEMAEKMIKK
jgi:hypothetical protein